MLVDFNHGSGFVYGRDASEAATPRRADQRPHRRRAGGRTRGAAPARLSRRQPHRRALRAAAGLRGHPHAARSRQGFRGARSSHLRGRACLRGSGDPLAPAGRVRSAHADASWRPVRFRDGGRTHSRPCGRRDRRRPGDRPRLARALGTQGAESLVLVGHGEERRAALEARLFRPDADLHGLHGPRVRAFHRAEQGHLRALPRACAVRSGRRAGAVGQGGRRAARRGRGRSAAPHRDQPDFFLCRFCPFAARCWEDRA